MKKSAIILILLMVFNKVFGLAREMTLSYFYGTEIFAEAFVLSNQIPTVIFGFVGAGITASVIPLYSKIKEKTSEVKATEFISNFINILCLILISVTILGLFFTDSIVKVFASGFTGDVLEIAIQFTRISLLGIVFTGLMSILNGYLQVNNHFYTAPIAAFVMNITTIISIAISSKTDPILLAVGALLSTILQFLVVYFITKKSDYTHKWRIDFKDENIKILLFMALPVIFGSSVDQINQVIDKTLASGIIPGAIAMLNYAVKISDSVLGLFVASITTVFFPIISKYAAQGKIDALIGEISNTLNSVYLLIIPGSVGFMIYSYEIVDLFYGRGKFDENSIKITALVLATYALGNFAYASRQVLTRIFYALHDTKTPLFSSTLGVVFNVILTIILSKYFGLPGLTLATTLAAYISVFFLLVALRRKIGPFGMKDVSFTVLKIVFASGVMAATSLGANRILISKFSVNIALMISIFIAILVYFVVISFMKIQEVDQLKKSVSKKLRLR